MPVSARLLRPTFVALGFALRSRRPRPPKRPRYCRSVAARLKADSDLAAAARAAFGEPQATEDDACLYPLQLLRYADVDVLVSQTGEPGEACHGCEASLSATVLKRVPGGYKRARSFDGFAKGGTFGAVASVTPIAIGGDDGIAIESGGLFQGYASSALDLYAFRRRARPSRRRRAADRRRRQQRRRDRRRQDDRGRGRLGAVGRRADDRLSRRRRPRQARQPRCVDGRRDDPDRQIRRPAKELARATGQE